MHCSSTINCLVMFGPTLRTYIVGAYPPNHGTCDCTKGDPHYGQSQCQPPLNLSVKVSPFWGHLNPSITQGLIVGLEQFKFLHIVDI